MNIEHQYAPNGIQSIMFMAMVQWKKNMEVKLIRPSLQHIADALNAVSMNKHFLCKVIACYNGVWFLFLHF